MTSWFRGSTRRARKVEVLATGLPASPGAAVGQIVFTADEAVEKAGHGQEERR